MSTARRPTCPDTDHCWHVRPRILRRRYSWRCCRCTTRDAGITAVPRVLLAAAQIPDCHPDESMRAWLPQVGIDAWRRRDRTRT